jgi:uncharacterized protein (TIGR03067 family)
MRRLCLPLAALLVLPLLGSDAPRGYDGATEADDIQGTWEFTRYEYGGRAARAPHFRDVTTYRGGTFTTARGDGDTIRGSYRLDPASKPSRLVKCPVVGPQQGRATQLIYEVNGDTLRVAELFDADGHPQGFKDRGVVVLVYTRAK